ncbi:D-aminoacyl-tRNA deacylase 1-like isoform X2 [Anopheles funestus]|uniref:D-aminoacyl-tRNA deacylase 1-like isoform X2 n=1 Tax=Anopheles funestus TaxID=62324 RepID=UPI0020C648F0|nr:D-aminoacyl-tRNA deacylase 1-like isoform X2 [Anopheles funestus]
MKAIIQRVTSAKVMVGDETVSSIGRGLCVLVGISSDDNANDVEWMWRTKVAQSTAVR